MSNNSLVLFLSKR